MAGSSTKLVDHTEEPLSSRHLFGSSLSSLSSPRRKSEISKAYKDASSLFLTRRLPEALSTIEPYITVPQPLEDINEDGDAPRKAPVAGASWKTRAKVWVLYVTLLHAIAELGPEAGSVSFGKEKWKDLVTKAQDGSIWDEVVQIGYGGIEGNVDADVVISLATLLLAQSSSQKSNQQHLESYLSAPGNRELDFGDHLNASETPTGHNSGKRHHSNGTDTPGDLGARVSIIELYTLHVLPRNGEWEYAKDFINMSEVLDGETREGLLQDLQSLQDEEFKGEESYEDAVPQQEDLVERYPRPAQDTERESIDTVRQVQTPIHHRSNSETDYGIDNAQPPSEFPKSRSSPPQSTAKPTKAPPKNSSQSPPVKASRKSTNPSPYKRSIAVISALQHLTSNIAKRLSRNPMVLLRFLLFLMGVIMTFSRRNVKMKLGRLTGAGWEKVKRTIGMGVKVSYI